MRVEITRTACLSWLGLYEFFVWFSELASGLRVRGLVVLESAAAYGYTGRVCLVGQEAG